MPLFNELSVLQSCCCVLCIKKQYVVSNLPMFAEYFVLCVVSFRSVCNISFRKVCTFPSISSSIRRMRFSSFASITPALLFTISTLTMINAKTTSDMPKITNESFLETVVLHLAYDLVSSSILLGVYWLSYSVFAAQRERLSCAQTLITRISRVTGSCIISLLKCVKTSSGHVSIPRSQFNARRYPIKTSKIRSFCSPQWLYK